MAFEIFLSPAFSKSFDRYSSQKQELIAKSIEALKEYLKTFHAPYGLRIKKLHVGDSGKVFEARVSLDIRIVWVQQGNEIIFSLLGNHEEVRRFLKSF